MRIFAPFPPLSRQVVIFCYMLVATALATSAAGQVSEISRAFIQAPRTTGFLMESSDTLELPFADDFSYPLSHPTTLLWSDQKCHVGDAQALFPKSVGVATFDGLDSLGFAYAAQSVTQDTFADVLTSKFIDLSNTSNVFLTFLYQEGGRGELPSTDDSLVVQFWSPSDSIWTQHWGVKGTGSPSGFRSAVVPVQGQEYLQRGFRFRIAAYGSRAGNFDIWNIDYVQLDKDRNAADTIITEPAFSKPHPLISGSGLYTSWPWWLNNTNHIGNVPSTLTFTYRRNGNVPSGGWSLNLGRYEWVENGNLVAAQSAVPVVTNTNHDQDLTFTVQVPSAALTNLSGPTKVETKVWFDGSAAGFRSNDTVRGELNLDNYLALEDGSAERAYAVQNTAGGRVAQRFRVDDLGPSDSLKGLWFKFVDAGPRYQSTFRLAIWAPADSSNGPGDLIYMTDSLYRPHWGYNKETFMPFNLDSAISLFGYTYVYVGYICTDADPLFVGLDTEQELPNALPRYYGDGFNWYPSLEPGIMLMRPYFSYAPANLKDQPFEYQQLRVVPNPAKELIQLNGLIAADLVQVIIRNAQGRTVMKVPFRSGDMLDISVLPEGTYILTVKDAQQIQHLKFIRSPW